MTHLPEGWLAKPLGEVAETQLGKMLNRSEQKGDSTIPYLRNVNVQWGRIDLSDVKQMDIYPDERSKFTAEPGDLLVCEGGESGRAAIWSGSEPVGIQNAIHRIRPKAGLDTRYLLYYFEWQVKSKMIDHLLSGVTITHLTQEKLRRMVIQYPTLDEQHRIVETLDDHLSRLDKALAELEHVDTQTLVLRRSILNELLNPESLVSEQGIERMILGSELVERHRLGDLVTFSGGFSFKSSDWKPSGIPVIKIANVRHGDVNLEGCSFIDLSTAAASADYKVQKGDLLMTLTGEIGAMGIYKSDTEARLNQRLCRVSIKNDKNLLLDYVHYFLSSPRARQSMWLMSKGAAQANISVKDIATLEISVPPLEVQRRIIETLDEGLSRLDSTRSLVASQKASLQTLRRSLLNKAFNGELGIH